MRENEIENEGECGRENKREGERMRENDKYK